MFAAASSSTSFSACASCILLSNAANTFSSNSSYLRFNPGFNRACPPSARSNGLFDITFVGKCSPIKSCAALFASAARSETRKIPAPRTRSIGISSSFSPNLAVPAAAPPLRSARPPNSVTSSCCTPLKISTVSCPNSPTVVPINTRHRSLTFLVFPRPMSATTSPSIEPISSPIKSAMSPNSNEGESTRAKSFEGFSRYNNTGSVVFP